LVIETTLQFPICISRGKAYAYQDKVYKFDLGKDKGCVKYGDSLRGIEDCIALADKENDPKIV